MKHKLTYRTKETKVTLIQSGSYVIVECNGYELARFDLADVWDFTRDSLKVLLPHTEGLSRRVYEASNLYKLTNEFLDIKEEMH